MIRLPGNDEMEPSAGMADVRDHVLLTVLGTNTRSAHYTLDGRDTEAHIAPVALFELLPDRERPNRVLALCTAEAKQASWPLLERALAGRCGAEPIDVPGGETQEEVSMFLSTVAGTIAEPVDLTVDVTHGFRHFSFLTYLAVLYLAALRGVRICGAYYGMLNRKPNLSPFLDLRPMLELPRWIHALQVLRDTGSTLPIATILLDRPGSQSARDNARDLRRLSEAYLAGLPLELGRLARNVRHQSRRPLKKLLQGDHQLPLSDNLVALLGEILKPISLTEPSTGAGWKRSVPISKIELQRQAAIIDRLVCHESVATAVRLLREWTVSWVIWQRAPKDDWLSRDVRYTAENVLHAIKAIGSDEELQDVLSEKQFSLARFWEHLAEVRNAYAHHGMRGDDLVRDRTIANMRRHVLDFWKQNLRTCPRFDLSLGESPGDRVLVSPIGLRPGVLFSAVHACRADNNGDPASCLVICSQETEAKIPEALQEAGYRGRFEPLRLDDAFGGSSEIRRLVQAARRHFIGAPEVLVNVTGGTTLMGLAAEELGAAARALACPVRRFGLIDHRPGEQQDAEPYQTGEPFWLDEEAEHAN